MEENNKDKILKEAENSNKEIDDRIELTRKQRFANKVHPNGSLILMFVIIILLGVAIGTIYLDNFVKVSMCLFIVSCLLVILSYNFLKFYNISYLLLIFILSIYSLIATYAFNNNDLLYQVPILCFLFNIILVCGKFLDLKKVSNKKFNITSFILLPLLLISNIVVISLFTLINYKLLTLVLMCLNLVFIIYNLVYLIIFNNKIVSLSSKN